MNAVESELKKEAQLIKARIQEDTERLGKVEAFLADVLPGLNGNVRDTIAGVSDQETKDRVHILQQIKGRKGRYRFTKEEVRAIRERHASGEKSIDIAKSFGVHVGTVQAITSRRTYGFVREARG